MGCDCIVNVFNPLHCIVWSIYFSLVTQQYEIIMVSACRWRTKYMSCVLLVVSSSRFIMTSFNSAMYYAMHRGYATARAGYNENVAYTWYTKNVTRNTGKARILNTSRHRSWGKIADILHMPFSNVVKGTMCNMRTLSHINSYNIS